MWEIHFFNIGEHISKVCVLLGLEDFPKTQPCSSLSGEYILVPTECLESSF